MSNRQRTSSEKISIEPTHAAWEEQELARIECVADEAGSLAGTYVKLPGDFYAYTGTDPDEDGTGIEYLVTAGDSAELVAASLAEAIDDESAFNAVVDPRNPEAVLVQVKQAGAVSAAAAGDSGFTITQLREGSIMECGFIDGDIELGLTEDLADVTAHQTGTQIIQALRTGRNIENISIPMKESDAARLKQIIEASGVEYTPDGGTAVSAWGSEDTKSVGNISADCRKLVLHPVRKAESDLSEDMCFWRAYPMLEGITLSGENPRIVNVSFKIIPDELLVREARQFVFGDHSQKFLLG
jgi:hypothetical protein